MSQHPIDKLFQEGLGKHKASVPDSLWASIAADQEKKVKKAWNCKVAMLSGSLLLALLVSFLFWQNGQQSAEPTNTAPIAAGTTQVEQSSAIVNHETPTVATATESAVTNTVTETTTANTSANNDVTQLAITSANRPTPLNNQGQPVATKRKNNDLDPQVVLTNQATSLASVTTANELSNTPSSTHTTTLPEHAMFTAPNLMVVDPVMTLPLPLLAPYERKLPEVTAHTNNRISKRKKAIEIDILGGFAYAHQLLKVESEENRNTLNAREISEFPGLSYLAGLRFSYRLSNRISLRSGLNYGQIRNQFEYDQINNFGTDSVQTLLIRSSNRLRLLEVPFLVGFELPGKRFRLAINAGPVVNLSTKASGRYLLPNQQQPIRLEDENIYRSNIGLGWQGSLTAAYDLGGGNSLLIEPTFKSYPRSFTTADYPLDERYWMAGLQIGLRHKIR